MGPLAGDEPDEEPVRRLGGDHLGARRTAATRLRRDAARSRRARAHEPRAAARKARLLQGRDTPGAARVLAPRGGDRGSARGRVAPRPRPRVRGDPSRADPGERRERGGRRHVGKPGYAAGRASDARLDEREPLARGMGRERGGPPRTARSGRSLGPAPVRPGDPQPHAHPRSDREREHARPAARHRARPRAAARDGRDPRAGRRPRGRPRQLACADATRARRAGRTDQAAMVPRCARHRRRRGRVSRRGAPARRRRARLARRAVCDGEGIVHLPRDGGQRVRVPQDLRAHGRRALAGARPPLRRPRARQVERASAERGRGRYSLWTGDLGTALFAADCIDARTAYPVLDSFDW